MQPISKFVQATTLEADTFQTGMQPPKEIQSLKFVNCRKPIALYKFVHMDIFIAEGQKRVKLIKHKFRKPRDCIAKSGWLSNKGCMQCNDSKIHIAHIRRNKPKYGVPWKSQKKYHGAFKDKIQESLVKRREILSCIKEADIH